MLFEHPDIPIGAEQIAACENSLGIKLPDELKRNYLNSNGGSPEPCVFTSNDLDTVVSEFLPLVSHTRGTSVRAYSRLVLQKRIVETNFFPFAIDGGGDYFFIDTNSKEGDVFFYSGDATEREKLLNIEVNLRQFWAALV